MDHINDIDSLSFELTAFYVEVRELVVLFLIFVLLFFLAHLTLRTVFAGYVNDCVSRSDRAVHQIVFGICTFTLTVCFTGYLLLLFSIVIEEILLDLKHSYYFQWLDPRLVSDLTFVVKWGTKIVCVILPFSYFLLISAGLRALNNSFTVRFFEASLNVAFFYILVCGTFWSFLSCSTFFEQLFLWSCDPFVYVNSMSTFLDYVSTISLTHVFSVLLQRTVLWCLQSIHLLSSLLGLIFLLVCTPLGILRLAISLLASAVKGLSDTRSKKQLSDNITEIYFDALQLKDGIQSASCFLDSVIRWFDDASLLPFGELTYTYNSNWRKQFLLASKTRMPELCGQFYLLKQRTSPCLSNLVRSFFQPLIPYFTLCLLFCMFHITQSFVFVNIVSLIQHFYSGYFNPMNDTAKSNCDSATLTGSINVSALDLGYEPPRSSGHFNTFLQICAVHFLLVVNLWGIYSLPVLSHLHPRPHSLTLEGILINVFLLFLFSCALPLQTNLLGLTALTLPNLFGAECGQHLTHPFSEAYVPSHNTFNHIAILDRSNQKEMDFIRRKCMLVTKAAATQTLPNFEDFHVGQPVRQCNVSFYLLSSDTIDIACIWTQLSGKTSTISLKPPINRQINAIILLYNLVFLLTSIWTAGRRLGSVTLTVGLEIVTSLRYVNFDQE